MKLLIKELELKQDFRIKFATEMFCKFQNCAQKLLLKIAFYFCLLKFELLNYKKPRSMKLVPTSDESVL